MEITIIHTNNEPSIHVKHFFDINELERIGLNLNEILLFYGV